MHRRHFLSLGSVFMLPSVSLASLPPKLTHNPLLKFDGLPDFAHAKPAHIAPALAYLLGYNKEVVQFISTLDAPTWQNFYLPLQHAQNQLQRAWHIASHLSNVKDSKELRIAYEKGEAALSDYETWYGTYRPLYEGFLKLKQTKLTPEQARTVANTLQDFELSGVALPADKSARYGEITKRLSELSTTFGNNVLDATMAYTLVIDDPKRLAGLPKSAVEAAQKRAKDKGKKGYLFGLDYPSYQAIMTYADDRELRRTLYRAYTIRASDQGDQTRFDNTPVIQEIIALRYELANLLGYPTYADYALAKRMANTPSEVMGFLNNLLLHSRPKAQEETKQLEDFAKTLGIETLEVFDVAYVAEKHRAALYDIDQETLREYFELENVLAGLFGIAHDLFGIDIKEAKAAKVWDKSVRFFELYKDGTPIAMLYMDLYARDHKSGGAWMNSAIERVQDNQKLQLPVAHIVCNFEPPVKGKTLLLHDDVTTLFHEFGHALHLMLTQGDILAISGINGVAWDAVEFPSQLLENWTWDKQALRRFAKHHQTQAPLDDATIERLIAAKNHLSARQMVRQLEFALFDFRLNHEYRPDGTDYPKNLREQIKTQVSVLPEPEWTRTAHAFSHVFAGGYAAGYYSYLWADVLSSDAFERFERQGLFNRQVGQEFVNAFLGQGGSKEPMAMFVAFMGRPPATDALLKARGIL